MKTRLTQKFLFIVALFFLLSACNSAENPQESVASTDPVSGNLDDTYVPDFGSGDLHFTQVWVKDVAEVGFPTKIWFDVENTGEHPYEDIYVRFDLKWLEDGDVRSLNLSDPAYTPDYYGKDIKVGTLQPGDKQHIEAEVLIEHKLVEGVYAGVFSVNNYNEDGEQVEVLKAAPGSILVGKPDLPNLRILDAQIAYGNSIVLPQYQIPLDLQESYTPVDNTFRVSVALEAMAHHIQDPVDVEFKLGVPGFGNLPLFFQMDSETNQYTVRQRDTLPERCKLYHEDGDPVVKDWEIYSKMTEGELSDYGIQTVCASLFREEPSGKAYNLELSQEAYHALASLEKDTRVELVIEADPDHKIQEWKNNTGDNQVIMPLMYLVAQDPTALAAQSNRSSLALPSSATTVSLAGEDGFIDLDKNESLSEGNFQDLTLLGYTDKDTQSTSWIPAADNENRPAGYYQNREFEGSFKMLNSDYKLSGSKMEIYYNIDEYPNVGYYDFKFLSFVREDSLDKVLTTAPTTCENLSPSEQLSVSNCLSKLSVTVLFESKKEQTEMSKLGFAASIVTLAGTKVFPSMDELWVDTTETESNRPVITSSTGQCIYLRDWNAEVSDNPKQVKVEIPADNSSLPTVTQDAPSDTQLTPEEFARYKEAQALLQAEREKYLAYVWTSADSSCARYQIWSSLDPDIKTERFAIWFEWENNHKFGPVSLGYGFAGQFGSYGSINLYPDNFLVFERGPFYYSRAWLYFLFGTDKDISKIASVHFIIGVRSDMEFYMHKLATKTYYQLAPSLNKMSIKEEIVDYTRALNILLSWYFRAQLCVFDECFGPYWEKPIWDAAKVYGKRAEKTVKNVTRKYSTIEYTYKETKISKAEKSW
jgi:hypothetical protein